MPYQRLQVSRALKVKPTSADINVSPDIPDPDFAGLSGTNASVTANKLVISNNAFTASTVQSGFIVENVTDTTYAFVLAVDNDNTLSLSNNIFTGTSKNYQIYSQSTRGCILYVGGEGKVRCVTAAGDTVQYEFLQAGTFLPVQIIRLLNHTGGGTGASDFIAHW